MWCKVDVHWSSGVANRAFYLMAVGLNGTCANGTDTKADKPAAIGACVFGGGGEGRGARSASVHHLPTMARPRRDASCRSRPITGGRSGRGGSPRPRGARVPSTPASAARPGLRQHGADPRSILPGPTGIKDACGIFYRATRSYLAKNSDYFELRASTVRAAEDAHGAGSRQAAAVAAAWDIVGAPTYSNPKNVTRCDAKFATRPGVC